MGMLWPTLETLLGVAVVIVLWLGWPRGYCQHRIRSASFVAFNTYMVQLTWPYRSGLGDQFLPARHRFHGSHSERLPEQPEITDARRTRERNLSTGNHAATSSSADLTFRYGNTLQAAERARRTDHDDDRLRNVNLRAAGASLAIVDVRFRANRRWFVAHPPHRPCRPGFGPDRWPAGSGVSARTVCERNIGFVPQETFLFSDSTRENISFGGADDRQDVATRPRRPASPKTLRASPRGYAPS